jgi:hypothetical protein
VKERDLQKLILDWLALHRIFHWRNNTGAMFGEHKGKMWAVRFGKPGAPDIFAMRPTCDPAYGAEMYGIEVKGEDGEQSEDQKKFQEDFTRAGGEYILARCLEDVTKEIG